VANLRFVKSTSHVEGPRQSIRSIAAQCCSANRPGNMKQMLTFNFRGMYDMRAYT